MLASSGEACILNPDSERSHSTMQDAAQREQEDLARHAETLRYLGFAEWADQVRCGNNREAISRPEVEVAIVDRLRDLTALMEAQAALTLERCPNCQAFSNPSEVHGYPIWACRQCNHV